MLKAEIYISLKKTVADPQGLTIKHALDSLGYKEASKVRIGKLIEIDIDLVDKELAEQKVDEMCKKLLANTIIEDYKFQIKEIDQ